MSGKCGLLSSTGSSVGRSGARRRRVGAFIVVALVVAGCGSGDDAEDSEDSEAETSPVTSLGPGDATVPSSAGGAPETANLPPIVAELRAAGAGAELFSGVDGLTTYVSPDFVTGVDDPQGAAAAYLAKFGAAYGVADPNSRFEVVSSTETSVGTVVRLAQSLDGLPVLAGEITITVNVGGEITAVTGVVAPDAELDDPTRGTDEASAAAVAATGGRVSGEPELVAYSPAVIATDHAPPTPAWSVPVLVPDDGVELGEVVVVSAVDGTVLMRFAVDMTGENWDLSDAQNKVDDDGKATFDDAVLTYEMRDGVRTEIEPGDADAVAAADNFTISWDYWMDNHGRDGHDGNGGMCDIYVNVGDGWNNASSNANCFVRIGDGQAYAQSLDVLAHEFAHSVTGQTSGLVYLNQSGALNEHYSDFFAVMTDTSDWLISMTSRDVSAPAVDRWTEFVVTSGDKGGVHTNSGIGNYASFLVADTGTNTHPDTGVTVTGIGRGKAASLWYATLQSLAPMTSYHAWACATIRSAHRMDNFTEQDVIAVEDAMIAVELAEPDEELGGLPSCVYAVSGGNNVVSPPEPTTPPPPTTPGGETTLPGATTIPGEVTTSTTSTTTTVPACSIVGSWRLQDQAFFDEIARIAGGGPGEIQYDGGDYLLQINADGTLASERREWALRVSSPQGAIVTVISSIDDGWWSADDSTIFVAENEGDAVVSIFLEVGGVLTPVPFGANIPTSSNSVSGIGTYTCVGDVLTVVAETEAGPFTAIWDRVG